MVRASELPRGFFKPERKSHVGANTTFLRKRGQVLQPRDSTSRDFYPIDP
jgi:hypothetical protein